MYGSRTSRVLSLALAVALSTATGRATPQLTPPPGPVDASPHGGSGATRDTGDTNNISLIGRWAEGLCLAADGVGDIAYFGNGAYLEIVDFSTPGSPVELARLLVPGPIYDVEVVGGYAYVADYEDGLRIIDISNPSAPVEVATLDTPYRALGVHVANGYAYVADSYYGGLRIIDVSTPTAPVEVGWFDTQGNARRVALAGSLAYVADELGGLRIIDVSSPSAPVEVGYSDAPNFAHDVAVTGNIAYVADQNAGLRVIDVTNPATPFEVTVYNPGSGMMGVAIEGSYLYVAAYSSGIRVLDISTPEAPVEVGYYVAYNPTFFAWDVAISGTKAYMADNSNAMRVIDISAPMVPTEIGSFGVGGRTYGVDVSGSYAYLATFWDGLSILDVSDQSNPQKVGSLETDTAYDVLVKGSYAYLADGYSGLRIIDVSSPSAPAEVGCLDLIYRALAVDVSDDFAYLVGYSGGGNPVLSIVDISTVTSPVLVGSLSSPSDYGEDVVVVGDYAYVAAYSDGLLIVDVSDPAAPYAVSSLYTGPANGVAVDGGYAYVAAGGNKMSVIDISDPNFPTEVGVGSIPGVAWGIDLSGDLAFVASGEAGLLVFDVSDPTDPELVGQYDTGDYARRVKMHFEHAFLGDSYDGMWILGLTVLHTAINPATGSTYHLLGQSSWTAAEAMAVTLGGHLVTINDQAENDWIVETFGECPAGVPNDLLIGFNDINVEGTFEWTSGEPVTFTDWAPGEPNDFGGGEDYTRICVRTGDGHWNDYNGTDNWDRHGVVEVPGPAVIHTAINPANGHTYHLLEHSDWLTAEAVAELLGGHLVSIQNQAERDWVAATFTECPSGAFNDLLIGLNDSKVEGIFRWTSGEPVFYTDWAAGEPSDSGSGEDYVRMKRLAGMQWNDYNGADFSDRHGVVEVVTEPGVGYCFGDPGSGTPCPCSNDNDGTVPGSGCDNGVFSTGAKLIGGGIASIIADSLILSSSHLEPQNAGLYFQAENDLSPGLPWGGGLRCAGGTLKRIGVRFSDVNGYSDTSGLANPISVKTGNVQAGDTKYYQCWYRTTANPPCGGGVSDFNSTNGYRVTWIP